MARRRLPKDLQNALDQLEPGVARAFRDAIDSITAQADLQALAAAILAQDMSRAAEVAGLSAAAFAEVEDAIRAAHTRGGRDAVAGLPRITNPATEARQALHFDGRHQRAQAWVSQHSGTLITEIVQDQREMFRQVAQAGLAADRSPSSIARDLVGRINRATGRREGGFIGLTSRQAQSALNARAELDGLSAQYFNRALRDRRFDGLVRRAMRDGEPLTAADMDRVLSSYNRRQLRYRGELIARTEAIQAHRAGRQEAIRQVVETGAVQPDQIVKEWSASMDDRTRDDHAEMNGETVRGVDTPFTMPDGRQVLYPDEPNCRCVIITRIEID